MSSPQGPYNLGIAYLLCFCFGSIGAHHCYLNNTGMGVLYCFTAGLCLVGLFIDLCRMPQLVEEANRKAMGGVIIVTQPQPQYVQYGTAPGAYPPQQPSSPYGYAPVQQQQQGYPPVPAQQAYQAPPAEAPKY
eukprot:Unigene1521_Nuclearia_a/m.4740 Unigene1521_Nuclearia_a/g.4740  ORF Unigene1521_Nuclearia_a/g.4740 Unigene1521_Nuclearia_a/m.4740 type:complete len:133 (-) Unigene1521_Nuclearia_a:53-451(-)